MNERRTLSVVYILHESHTIVQHTQQHESSMLIPLCIILSWILFLEEVKDNIVEDILLEVLANLIYHHAWVDVKHSSRDT